MRVLTDFEGRRVRLTEARLYYRYYVGTAVGDKHLCVAVKVEDNDAFVLTAFLMRRPMGGRQLWPRKN
jgi:hypothetical protein